MSDFSDELRDTLRASVNNKITSDSELDALLEIIATSDKYEDAYKYAARYGGHVVDALNELGVDEWLFGTACEVWEPSLRDMYDNVGTMCDTIQANKNIASGIGIKPQRANYDFYSIKDMIQKVVENPLLLADEIDKHSMSLVDKNQKSNLDFMLNSGIKIVATRYYDGVGLHTDRKKKEACAFCLRLAKSYSFSNATQAGDSELFHRHAGCHCWVEYENKATKTRTTIRF